MQVLPEAESHTNRSKNSRSPIFSIFCHQKDYFCGKLVNLDYHILDHVIAFFLLITLPLMSLRSGEMSEAIAEMLPPKKHLYYTNGLTLIIGALIVLTSWNISDRPWSVLGMRWPEIHILVIYGTIIIAIFYLGDLISGLISKNRHQQIDEMSYVIPANGSEYKHYIFLAFAAGICEEIIFRGFLVNYLLQWDAYVDYIEYIAIVIPAFVFAISHLYQGYGAVIKIFIVAILFGVIFIYSKSLVIVAILHVVVDLISGLVGIFMVKKELEETP
jgi:membrane protease YdiL (CAAX protease family)